MALSPLTYGLIAMSGFAVGLTGGLAVLLQAGGMSGDYSCGWVVSDPHDTGKPFPFLP